ncbi:MAG: T9SS type A sorting domain-containing protein [Ignavibacteria bacterium]|nr:T9SS type A sorting domain-containing protein [Ignavibacteria bacterium]
MKKFLVSLSVLAVFLLGLGAYAQTLNPPHNLNITCTELNGSYQVNLTWNIDNQGTFPKGFNIYQKTIHFGTSKTSIVGILKAIQGKYEYHYTIPNVLPGVYEFYVTSYITHPDGKVLESKPSNIVRIDLTNQKLFIRIVSQPPVFAYVGVKYVYQVYVQTNINCPVDIFELSNTRPEGMKISNKGLLEWIPTSEGIYEVSIKAGTSCKINVEPAIQTFRIHVVRPDTHSNKPFVRIVSQPPTTAMVGVPWIYRVVTESNIRCPVEIRFQSINMDGAIFKPDESTVYWLPKEKGQFAGIVEAILTCDTNVRALQRICIGVVDNPQPMKYCVHIKGTAVFDDDTPVENGVAVAWKLDINDKQTNVYFKTYIKNGQFDFYLPEGTYIMEFYGEKFERMFYTNGTRPIDATRLKFVCEDTTVQVCEIQMVVRKLPEPEVFNVSGYVLSAIDNTPVMAIVEFIPLELFYNKENKDKYGVISKNIAKTDQNGFYSIPLTNNFTYIAHAIPLDKENYLDQYYKEVSSPYQADILELKKDLENINFYLKSPERRTNSITGIVMDKDRNPIESFVFALMTKPSPNSKYFKPYHSQVVETDAEGLFIFKNLPYGEYVLLSVPKDKAYVPGYYKMGDFATLKWREATRISVNDNMITIVYEIKHRTRTGFRGLVQVAGKVYTGVNLFKSNNQPQCDYGDPLSEVLVYVTDVNGDFLNYSLTDASGKFVIDELPPTRMVLYATKFGFKDYVESFYSDYVSNFNIDMAFALESEFLEVEGIEEPPFSISRVGQLLTIHFGENVESGKIALTDILGRTITLKPINGEKTTVLDLENLNSGLYFINLIIGQKVWNVKVTVY